MKTTLFLQSDVTDPYQIYAQMLANAPVFWDDKNRLWIIYSYEHCKAVLTGTVAQIPSANNGGRTGIDKYAFIANKLARLNNPPYHQIARRAAHHLFEKMKQVSVPEILEGLLQKTVGLNERDWVNAVCKSLPVLLILKGFQFSDSAIGFILSRMEQLVKMMLPLKTEEQIAALDGIAEEIYKKTEASITENGFLKEIDATHAADGTANRDDLIAFYISNLIGLIIQSYDAGRGVLSNSLLQMLLNKDAQEINSRDRNYFTSSVIETLRFDPPVHNTRRVLTDVVVLNGQRIEKGDMVVLMLAAANRDPEQFTAPYQYNSNRSNNREHLTFGAGPHMCLANHFSVNMATEVLFYLFRNYKVELLPQKIEYERLINARLPKELFISLS